jgi:hypothetical protein
MKSITYPYHVVLIPKTKTKRQRTWNKLPRWIKMSDSSRGHKISTRDGSVIDLDLTYNFLEYGSLCVRCVRFEKPNKCDLPPSTTRARNRFTPAIFPLSQLPTTQDHQAQPLVPNLAASTFTHDLHIWRARVAVPGIKNLKFKLGHYNVLKNYTD